MGETIVEFSEDLLIYNLGVYLCSCVSCFWCLDMNNNMINLMIAPFSYHNILRAPSMSTSYGVNHISKQTKHCEFSLISILHISWHSQFVFS